MFLLTVHDCSRNTPGFNFRKETIPMNFQNLEYLIEISNCGSISAAAKRLFVTQPYLSKVLRETEKEYGSQSLPAEKTELSRRNPDGSFST